MLENLYRNMKLNADELAKINKIELIIVDDSSGEFEIVAGVQISRQEQIAEQISRRKILYRAQAIDITDPGAAFISLPPLRKSSTRSALACVAKRPTTSIARTEIRIRMVRTYPR